MIQELRNSEPCLLEWKRDEITRLCELGLVTSEGEAARRRWSRAEYWQLVEAGLLEGKHVELLQGEIVVMHPMGSRHYNSVKRCELLLQSIYPAGYSFRTQATLDLGDNQPEPDVAVVSGHHDDYADHHPTTAVLVVEVAETSLASDRRLKASLYASAGIPEFWIVSLAARRVEVYRQPLADASQPFGHRYGDVQALPATASFAPLLVPDQQVRVTELLSAS